MNLSISISASRVRPVLVGDVLNGAALENACGHAMKTVYQIIMDNKDKEEKFFGADIERFIKEGKL